MGKIKFIERNLLLNSAVGQRTNHININLNLFFVRSFFLIVDFLNLSFFSHFQIVRKLTNPHLTNTHAMEFSFNSFNFFFTIAHMRVCGHRDDTLVLLWGFGIVFLNITLLRGEHYSRPDMSPHNWLIDSFVFSHSIRFDFEFNLLYATLYPLAFFGISQ